MFDFSISCRFRAIVLSVTLGLSALAMADSSSSPLVVWGPLSDSTPEYSVWSGSSWSTGANAVSYGCDLAFIAGANCPKRDESAFMAVDYCNSIKVFGRVGTTWTTPYTLSSSTDGQSTRMFDIAYESNSGDAILVYWNGSSNDLEYRIATSSSISSTYKVADSDSADVKWVRLRSRANSDEMIVVWLDSYNDIYTKVWNGSSWGSTLQLTTNANTSSYECFDLAYESQSGDALVAFCDDNSSNPRYRSWNGSSWSSESSMSNVGASGYFLRLAPDPTSDGILCGVQDASNDLNVQYWNGSSWSSANEVETSLNRNNCRQFDIAYENGRSEALIVYAADWSNNIFYRTWNGSSWSSEQTGTDVGNNQDEIQAVTGATDGQIFVQAYNDSNDLHGLVWGGSSFTYHTTYENNMGGWSYEPFATTVPTAASVTPADIPYFTDFESTVGAEWSTTTTDYDADFTTFLGRFCNGSADLYLNTTVGETYTLAFDFDAIDSWDGSNTDWGPDYFNVEVDGTQVFHQTFSNRPSDPSYPASYPNPAEALGTLGYDYADADGIYHITVSFTASQSITKLTFEDGGLQDIDDESWGIDNVSVALSRFHDVSVAKGFDVQTTTDDEYASGIYWADFDNDGDLDAILGGNSSSRYMRNNSQGSSFTASTFGTGNERRGAALFDMDNDGDVDFWSGNHNSYYVETCYENNGSASFSDAGNLGFPDPNNNEGVAAADVNHDGWCDIVHFSENGNWIGEHQGDPGGSSVQLVGTNDVSIGLNDSGDVGNGDYASSGDVNNDGYLDYFYHYNGGKLFLSSDGMDFVENTHGIWVVTGGSDKFGSAWGDYDNDGDLDLYASRRDSGSTGYLWRNDVTWSATPTGSFTNETANAYIKDTSGQRGCAWGDYDNDGDLDLYVVTRNAPNCLYQNQGDGTFRLVDEGASIDGDGQDAVFVDYDNDGDLDIAYTRGNSTAVLLENRTNDSNYLKVRVVGAGSGGTNVAAIGVRVELWNAAGTTRLGRRDIGVARGYGGTEPLWAHFGGVDPATAYLLKVWLHSRANDDPLEVSVTPNAVSTTIGSVTIPQMITVEETDIQKKIIMWREVPNRN